MDKFDENFIKAVSKSDSTAILNLQTCRDLVRACTLCAQDDRRLLNDTCYAFIVLNSWCAKFADLTGLDQSILATRIRQLGLRNSIEEAGQHRLWIIDHTRGCVSNFWRSYHIDALTFEFLDFLDFPKRLRLESQDFSFMYDEYLASNLQCATFGTPDWWQLSYNDDGYIHCSQPLAIKKYGTNISNNAIFDSLRYVISYIFKNWKQDTSLFTLPPGASYEGAHTYFDKFCIALDQQEWLRQRGVCIPHSDLLANRKFNFKFYKRTFTGTSVPSDTNRYVIVPKTFKTGRGVAPEPVSRQVLGYQVDSGMRKCLKKIFIDLNDQSRNRQFCSLATELGLATVDMKSASDTISLGLVRYLFSDCPALLERLEDCRTSLITINGSVYENCRFATMGNAITFALESSIFAACAALSIRMVYPRWSWKKIFSKIAIYGDDVILPSEAYECFCHIATVCGFTVNMEKSFAQGFYRESCGVESIDSETRQLHKWPRGLAQSILGEVIAQQHVAAENYYSNLDYFLTKLILDAFPRVSTKDIGTPSLDLWSSYPHDDDLHPGKYSPYAKYNLANAWYELDQFKNLPRYFYNRLVNWRPSTISSLTVKGSKGLKYIGTFTDSSEQLPKYYKAVHRGLRTLSIRDVYRAEGEPEYDYIWLNTLSSHVGINDIPYEDRPVVELLAYLLHLGSGIEHINSSAYTDLEDTILDRRDLYAKRRIMIKSGYTLK